MQELCFSVAKGPVKVAYERFNPSSKFRRSNEKCLLILGQIRAFEMTKRLTFEIPYGVVIYLSIYFWVSL